jgi:hypothetical protein
MQMFRYLFSLAAIATIINISAAQPLPPSSKFVLKSDKVKYTPCRLMTITAEGGGKTVLWRFEGPINDSKVDNKTLIIVPSDKNLVITIKCYTASPDGDILEAVLILEADVPPIPPPPPVPNDPLTNEIRNILNPTDKPDVKLLAQLYKLMSEECDKSEYTTALDINTRYQSAATNLVGNKLIPVRTRFADEIIKAIAGIDPDTPLTPQIRKSLADVFTRLYKVCLEV